MPFYSRYNSKSAGLCQISFLRCSTAERISLLYAADRYLASRLSGRTLSSLAPVCIKAVPLSLPLEDD